MVLSEFRRAEAPVNDTVKNGKRIIPVPGAQVTTMEGWPGKVVQETVGLIRRASHNSDQTRVANLRSLAIETDKGKGFSDSVSAETFARIREIEKIASTTTNEVERARLIKERDILKDALTCGSWWN